MATKNFNYKLVLLGDTAVGKSCLATRFVTNQFFEFQEPTIGAAFLTKSINIEENTIKFEIWDTAGQERYRSLAPMYYRGAKSAIIIYDITNKDSFYGAKSWVTELLKKGNKNCVTILVGNKYDLIDNRKVDIDEVKNFTNENNILHIEVSAKTSHNVKELFLMIGRKLIENTKLYQEDNKLNLEKENENDNKNSFRNTWC